jgi:hypothetical protein
MIRCQTETKAKYKNGIEVCLTSLVTTVISSVDKERIGLKNKYSAGTPFTLPKVTLPKITLPEITLPEITLPERGLEPPIPCEKRFLKPPRIPFRHSGTVGSD